MQCPTCGTENPPGNRFCNNCGSSFASDCPNCGSSNAPGSQFCGQCGTSLTQEAAAAPALAPEEEPAAERRLVSVLFADLVGFTPFSEDRDPEDVRALLTDYFDRCREVIERFGGIVDKFIGDAVTAVWGAETANEDDAERAVRAGLELVDVVAKLGADVGAPELALRVGVLTGEASVGPGGNQMGLVAGDMVNTASRLQSVADPGTVLVGESTYLSAQQAVSFEAVGEKTVKGKELPVAAWRAVRVVAERGGRGRAEILEPPFVGRTDELRLLKDMLASVGRERHARLVSIVGEAGVGKSRLIWEFLKYVDGLVEDVYWHEGRSPAYGDGVTFWAVAEMIRRRAGIAETDTPAETSAALQSCLEQYLPDEEERAWVEPRLAAVLGLAEAPSGDRAELDAAVRAFFEGIAQLGTTALVFEDLHWADAALLDFVEELTDWSRDHPILVVTLARPDLLERRPTWGAGKRGFVSLHLGPLTDSEMTDLVAGMVPGLEDEAVRSIVGRAAGIPLYAVEMVRMLLAQGDLEESDGGFHISGDLTDLAVPESLQAVIGARLDRLESPDRALIQDAAVLGHAFTLDGLGALASLETSELEARLSELARRELVEPVRDPRSPERGQYRFVQELIREVALSRMGRDARRGRHLEAASYYEKLDDPELAVVVASHFLDAYRATPEGSEADRLRGQALATLSAAVDRAAALRSHEQVLSTSEQALDLAVDDSERVAFWERMAEAATPLARREEAERCAQQALDYFRASGDEAGVNRVTRLLGFAYTEGRQYNQAVDMLSSHLDGRDDLDSDPELAAAAAVYARAVSLTDRPSTEAIAVAERALDACERLGLTPSVVDALITRGTAAGNSGRWVEARILLEGAIALADEHDLSHAAMRGRNNLAATFGVAEPVLALEATQEAFRIARRIGYRSMVLFLGQNLVGWYSARGQFDKMEEMLADPLLEDAPDHYVSGMRNYQARVALAQGDRESGRRLYEEARRLFEGGSGLQPQLSMEATRLAIKVHEGDLRGSFEEAASMEQQHGWLAVLSVGWIAFHCAAWSGDRQLVERLLASYERYAQQLERQIRVLRELLLLPEGDDRALSEAELVVTEFEDSVFPFQAIHTRGGIVRFLPPDHPERARILEDARRRCDELGLVGLKNLLESQVAEAP